MRIPLFKIERMVRFVDGVAPPGATGASGNSATGDGSSSSVIMLAFKVVKSGEAAATSYDVHVYACENEVCGGGSL